MIRVKVTKQGKEVQRAEFDDNAKKQAWLDVLAKGDSGWGLPERWVNEDQCSEDDKLASLETRPIEMSNKVEHRLPAQFSIIEEDITAEIEAKAAKKERLQALKDKHAAMKPSDLDTIVELRQAILELQEILGIR